jgi:hypothetical protein
VRIELFAKKTPLKEGSYKKLKINNRADFLTLEGKKFTIKIYADDSKISLYS